jgi:hypothetical protein
VTRDADGEVTLRWEGWLTVPDVVLAM